MYKIYMNGLNWDGHGVVAQIYIFHIYTRPKFTDPTFTQNPDLHKPKFTQLRFTQNQIYTALHWHTQIYTTQIYTKLNPNLHRPKFTFTFLNIHFGTIVARSSRARGSKRSRLRRFAFLVVCKFGLRKFGFCVNLGRVNLGCLKSVQKCECKFGPV